MRYSRIICVVALGWPLLACDPPERSDQGQYDLQVDLTDRLAQNSHRVLVGTSFELYIEGLRIEGEVDEDGGGLGCAVASADGSLTEVGPRQYLVASAGPGAVEFAAPIESCPANTDVLVELGPDSWSMVGVEPTAVTGMWIGEADGAVLTWETSPGPAGVFPDALGRPLDDPRVAADGVFSVYAALVDQSNGRTEVRWNDPSAFITVPGHYQELATWIDEDGELRSRTYLHGSLRAGDSFDSTITILDHAIELPPVVAVPTREITSLELVPVYATSDDPQREWGPPLGVVAITHDAEGRRILGPPIEWSITRGRLGRSADSYGSETILVQDCRDEPGRPQWRGATVEATLDDLVATVELEWLALPTDNIDPSSDPCRSSACDCSTAASPRDSVFATLALLALGGLLRHSRRRRADSTDPR